LRLVIEASPAVLALQERLGEALMLQGKFREAISAFRRRADAEPARFGSWGKLAQCHVEAGDAARALAACDLGENYGQAPDVARPRGEALEKLGRQSEAIVHLRQAFGANSKDEFALESLFRCLSREPDAAALLEFCETLPATPFFQSRRMAFRAIALSRLGRADEARSLIDVQRHVKVYQFTPSRQYDDVAAFNGHLADWLVINTGAVPTPRPDCIIDHELTRRQVPLMTELRSFFRSSFSSYIAELPMLGLGDLMPRPPTGELFDFVVFLRGSGRNGEHIHPNAYVIGVYYVQVPQGLPSPSDHRGCLVLGACEKLTNGHRPAWGTRYVRPEAGKLVIFPAHMFHDVVPTQCAEPRIVVGADVRPAASIRHSLTQPV
jgi:hypothetical protein